jgi:imidazole glycerol-phosphate synthase subunit HisH
MASIAIIDYGMGNLHSIAKAVEHVAGDDRVWVSADPDTIRRADRVIFPGVGAIRDCMAELRRLGLDELLREVARDKPLLGVCLGMQALLDHSEENGGVDGLGLIPARCAFPRGPDGPRQRRAPQDPPHGLEPGAPDGAPPLWKDIPDGSRFYFVHSYYATPADPAHLAGRTEYGLGFAAAVARENLFAVQCHPEKSQHAGLQLLANFVRWNGEVPATEWHGGIHHRLFPSHSPTRIRSNHEELSNVADPGH